jgi:hypothetical protein
VTPNGSVCDIGSVEIGRTLHLDGWGIHMSVRGGWVWNLWGRDCVVEPTIWLAVTYGVGK